MKPITLQQDAANKITVTTDEPTILYHLKKFFKWRKDISVERFNKLGTAAHDSFIAHLANTHK